MMQVSTAAASDTSAKPTPSVPARSEGPEPQSSAVPSESKASIDSKTLQAELAARPPNWTRVGGLMLDVGVPEIPQGSKSASATTIGVQVHALWGARIWAIGGLFRLGWGGLRGPKAPEGALLRLGPHAQIGLPLSARYPSFHLTGTTGLGVVSTTGSSSESAGYLNLFAAYGAIIRIPVTRADPDWRPTFLLLAFNRYHSEWFGSTPQAGGLAARWLEVCVGIGGAWMNE